MLIGILILLVILVVYSNFFVENRQIKPKLEQKTLKIGEKVLNIEIADNDTERTQGLSGRQSMAEDSAMLFVFEKEGYNPFWMKNMNFPIDIAWLDKDKKIIYIEKNASPDSYPQFIYASQNGIPALSLYVLETSANFFEKSKIKIGDVAEF